MNKKNIQEADKWDIQNIKIRYSGDVKYDNDDNNNDDWDDMFNEKLRELRGYYFLRVRFWWECYDYDLSKFRWECNVFKFWPILP